MASTAHIIVSEDDDGYYHVTCKTEGTSVDAAKHMAETVLHLLAGGRFAFIRVAPEAASDVDFATDKTEHRGYVRFTFRNEPGEWKHAARLEGIVTLGFSASDKDNSA